MLTIIYLLAASVAFTSASTTVIATTDGAEEAPVAEMVRRGFDEDPLQVGAASDSATVLSSQSHRIVASGWPSTTQMWPSLQTAAESQKKNNNISQSWMDMVDPFIFADKPRPTDYSLLLSLNKTVLDMLKAQMKPGVMTAVNLSFEYYFDYDPKVTALPGIKIEVDRKQFKYLEPSDTQLIKSKLWMNFNERIMITDSMQLDKPDWLKFSLVNRQSPSLVAIRRLQAEFKKNEAADNKLMQDTSGTVPDATPSQLQQPPVAPPPSQPQIPQPTPTVAYQEPLSPEPTTPPPQRAPYPPRSEAPLPQQPPLPDPATRPQPLVEPPAIQESLPPPPPQQQPPDQAPEVEYGGGIDQQQPDAGYEPAQFPQGPPAGPLAPGGYPEGEQYPAASNTHSTTVRPTESKDKDKKKKKKDDEEKGKAKGKDGDGSWWGRRRRKREVSPDISEIAMPSSIVLTCFESHQCDWKADGSEQIQWALARMPPSTKTVQSGYFYVSNRNSYGDLASSLKLSLNQTDSATIADQNSDHCIELALYITEGTHLKLYKLTRTNQDDQSQWSRGNLLMTWAPTVATRRNRLPRGRLAAMEDGQSGWTYENLCYGDFFVEPRECGVGRCAFGFEMEPDASQVKGQSASRAPGEKLETPSEASGEQVVGVALLKEYSINVPQKSARRKWLESWLREEVEPGDDWKFYPKLDYQLGANNVSLVNLYDDAHYFVESDWLNVNDHLELQAILAVELDASNETMSNISSLYDRLIEPMNSIPFQQQQQQQQLDIDNSVSTVLQPGGDIYVFSLKMTTKLVDAEYNLISANSSTVDWSLKSNSSLYNLGLSATEGIRQARSGQLKRGESDSSLFKIVFEFRVDTHWLIPNSTLEQFFLNNSNNLHYKISLANVSLSDRCSPSPCQFGSCSQNGTGYEDWQCTCEDKYRGRRCEFGRWCNLPHIVPWTPAPPVVQKSAKSQAAAIGSSQQRQPKAIGDSVVRVSGKDYCQRKLGAGFKCTDIDLPLNDQLYTEEDRTFVCSCQDDYYLSDDSKCKQAHLCNSIVCPSIGMICDDTRAFNRTQPCHCDEKQDWYPDPQSAESKCMRRQCQDKMRDCGFDAHICLPTLPGEKPICKCGPKFTLKTIGGQKYCQSTACVLPTLNECQQICQPDNTNLQRPYTCACHPGYILEPDGKSCRPARHHAPPHCRPACDSETQICTDLGCRCKQGYIGDGEVRVQQPAKGRMVGNSSSPVIEYVQSIRCLNVCSLTYAENKEEFEMIEAICPLGLCDKSDFKCRCADPSSSALINTKYEPIYSIAAANSTPDSADTKEVGARVSPLCQLRRVCEVNSSSYQVCKSQGAICVPDYTKAAMFDCICPPSTEKRLFGQQTNSEFTCEPRCSAKKSECLAHQAVCKLVDKDEVSCECLPGFIFDQHYQKCFLAKYSYAFNLLIVNRYYEPESKFHLRHIVMNSTQATNAKADTPRLFDHERDSIEATDFEAARPLSEIVPQYSGQPMSPSSSDNKVTSLFIAEYNQCNITQVIPKSVIEDPYEHNIESYLSYIDQCNEKIHQNVKTYHLNSRLGEDLRQSLRQHLRGFTVATNQSECIETDPTGMYLNCTIYLQSSEPVPKTTVEFVFNDCDKHGHDDRFCWIKPRLLLKQQPLSHATKRDELQLINATSRSSGGEMNFRQIVPCELNNFCGLDAVSVRTDDKTSLCSCKCPKDIEVIDVRDLEARQPPSQQQQSDETIWAGKISIKEICAPRNNCGANSTFCLGKTGSVCQYDIRLGSRCQCVYPSYEDSTGKCVEVTFSTLDNTFIVIIILLGTGLIVSIAINLAVVAKSQSLFGRSKQYPLNEFRPANNTRTNNRSTGMPNPVFTND